MIGEAGRDGGAILGRCVRADRVIDVYSPVPSWDGASGEYGPADDGFDDVRCVFADPVIGGTSWCVDLMCDNRGGNRGDNCVEMATRELPPLLLSCGVTAPLRCLSPRRDTLLPAMVRAGVAVTGATIFAAELAGKSRNGVAASAFGKIWGDAGTDPDAPATCACDDAALGASAATRLLAVA
ncbi:hypothetical protein [Paraburkholderia caffeinilytica]|uniref:hypothetical protein n=1 Tax=Paraburkholderia caffeinilytica TaxID=1761016 RepID=UPI0013BEA0B1|nr:hypothetical protein [Paraburkholderia caffeinilytica]